VDIGNGKGWSDWSDVDTFTMDDHAYPEVAFTNCPISPEPFRDDTQFCSRNEGLCGIPPLCQAPYPETTCYDINGPALCSSFTWIIPDATSIHDEDGNSDPPVMTYEINPEKVIFVSSGPKNVTLTVVDASPFAYSCTLNDLTSLVKVGLPLPNWTEIPPY